MDVAYLLWQLQSFCAKYHCLWYSCSFSISWYLCLRYWLSSQICWLLWEVILCVSLNRINDPQRFYYSETAIAFRWIDLRKQRRNYFCKLPQMSLCTTSHDHDQRKFNWLCYLQSVFLKTSVNFLKFKCCETL